MNHDHGCNGWSWIKIDWILDQKSYELLRTAFSPAGTFQCLFGPCDSNWGLWTHSLSLTWEPVRYANEQSHANHLLNQSLCFSHLRFGKPYRRWLHIKLSPPCSPIHVLRSIRTLVQGSLASDISCLMIWGGTEVRIVELKCTINVLESSPKPPTPRSLEKLSSMKRPRRQRGCPSSSECDLFAYRVTVAFIR